MGGLHSNAIRLVLFLSHAIVSNDTTTNIFTLIEGKRTTKDPKHNYVQYK